MKRYSKRYREALKIIDTTKSYGLKEAITILKRFPKAKFDESVELHFNINVDPKKTEQMVRGTVKLPHGTGKKIRIAVFCKGEHQNQAKEAGADIVGDQDLINKVQGGWLDFDKAIATPEIMKDLSKLGRILGPRGLMPTPKTGTVTNNVSDAIKEAKGGRIEFKMDKQSGIHLSVGKLTFDEAKIYENATSVMDAVNSNKPSQVKGKFIITIFISTTMNPGLRLLQG